MRTPCLTAASKAPAFSIKLRSLHVSPLSQKMTGIGEPLPALGSMTENFIVQPSTALACSYLPGAEAHRKRGETTVRVSRGGMERCQVSALAVVLYVCAVLRTPSSAHSLVHAGAKRLLALLQRHCSVVPSLPARTFASMEAPHPGHAERHAQARAPTRPMPVLPSLCPC